MGREYTQEFKEEAVALIKHSGKRLMDISRDLGVPDSTLCGWVRRARQEDQSEKQVEGLDLEKEVKQLRKENEVLKMERDILKKATAFFAKESR